jgi:glyoxylase-like metal-dependent hydrolase (beta-lactamase superfamily II)
MKITEGIFAYPWMDMMVNNCNSYVLQGELTILIDPGHSSFLEKLFESLKADNISPEKIDLVINTHAHPDHSEGNSFFDKGDTLITLHQEEDLYLKGEGGRLYQLFGLTMSPFPVEFYLTEGELYLGDIYLKVYHTPGHSPGSICLFWPAKKALISGDVLFYQGVGRTDIPGADSALLKESLERIAQLETEIILPGHGDLIIGRNKILNNYALIQQYIYELL